MALHNEIYKVFVTDKDLAASGKNITTLADNEVGLFDVETGLTVDDTGIKNQGRYYFAIKKNGKIVRSTNRWIDAKLIKSVAYKGYVAPVNQKFEIKDFKTFCGKTYEIILSISNNMVKFAQGVNTQSVLLIAQTEPCVGCAGSDPCAETDQLEVVKQWLGAKGSKYVTITAKIQTTQGSHTASTPITLKNIDTLIAYNKGKTADKQVRAIVEVEAVPLEKDNYKQGYFGVRNTTIDVIVKEAMVGNGTVTETAKNVIEQGAGFDIASLEYRQYQVTGRFDRYGHEDYTPPVAADVTKNYETIAMVFGNEETVGSQQYNHDNEIIVATVGTQAKLKAVFKKLAENNKAVIVGTL